MINIKHTWALVFLFTPVFLLTVGQLKPITPEQNQVITDRTPFFEWEGSAHTLVLDDNEEFTSPKKFPVQKNNFQLKEQLPFNTYYWKLIGKKESTVTSFSVVSYVALTTEGTKNTTKIKNIGNTKTKITGDAITGNVILKPSSSKSIPKSERVIAIQHE